MQVLLTQKDTVESNYFCCKETIVVFILRINYRRVNSRINFRGINYKKIYYYILRIAYREHLMTF